MKMSDGVEWAAHTCILLSFLPEGRGLNAPTIAEYHDLPPAYMAKHLQALAKDGVITSIRGAGGGYRLSKSPAETTLWDITRAIEGGGQIFRCSEIRQNGPCGAPKKDCKRPCDIASAFLRAETAWRDHLKAVSLLDLIKAYQVNADPKRVADSHAWLEAKLRK